MHENMGFNLVEFWNGLTEAQGYVIGGGFTLVAAICGVLLGKFLFGGKISDIERAIAASKELLDDHLSQVDETLTSIKEKTSVLDDVLAAVSQQVGRIAESSAMRDGLSFDNTESPASEDIDSDVDGGSNAPHKSDIRDLWTIVRDHLEATASDPEIDGRTRAKYMRIDRRAYSDLITSLRVDGCLTPAQADAARSADRMWNGFRPRSQVHQPPTVADIEKMKQLVAIATGKNID